MKDSLLSINKWTENYVPTIILGSLCSLLVLGKLIHNLLQRRGLSFGVLLIPPCFISGLIGLLGFTIVDTIDHDIIFTLSNGLRALKGNLVNYVFSSFVLGLHCNNSSNSHHNMLGAVKAIFHDAMPMIIYSQIIIWGQSACCLFVIIIGNMFHADLPHLFAATVPLGLEAGSDVVVSLTMEKHEYFGTIVEESESLGMLITCIMTVFVITMKPTLISSGWLYKGNSKDSTLLTPSLEESFRNSARVTHSPSRPMRNSDDDKYKGATTSDISNESSNHQASLGSHISLIATTVFMAFIILLSIRYIEIVMAMTTPLFSSARMFKLSMFCAMISITCITKSSKIRFNSDWFLRLSGLMLDLLIVASLTHSNPRPHATEGTHYQLCLFFVTVCFTWNIICFIFIAKKVFPNYWFERAVALSADALGHAYSGLFVIRVLDSDCITPIATVYAYKLLLFFIPSSGEKNNIVVLLLQRSGPLLAFLVCVSVCATWLLIFHNYYQDRFLNSVGKADATMSMQDGESLFSDNDSNYSNKKHDYNEYEEQLEFEDYSNCSSSTTRISGMTEGLTSLHTSDKSGIVSYEQLKMLQPWVDKTRSKAWSLSYSLRRDGASLDTLLASCISSNNKNTFQSFVFIIEDSCSHIFGGFINYALENKQTYYGNGESFVFSCAPHFVKYEATMKNYYFVISNNKCFGMGGGDGGFAFQLDDALDTGVSNCSDTYGNVQLSSSEFYRCLNCEVWSLSSLASADWV